MSIKKSTKEVALKGKIISGSRRKGETNCDEHWHEYYEMIYYHGCKGTCLLNGKPYPVSESCIFLMTPKDFHKTTNQRTAVSGSAIIQFSEQAVDINLLEILSRGPVVLYNPSENLKSLIGELVDSVTKNSRFKNEYLVHMLNCILINLIKEGECSSANSRKSDPAVRDAIGYMLKNLQSTITLTDMAKKYNLSATYFSHLFHDSTGVPFKKYLTNIRIEYAKRLLEDGELSVIDVGFECGFHTPSQFVRAFEGATGEAPSRYRQARRKKNK
jgi:AraC-like DNA-binding protein